MFNNGLSSRPQLDCYKCRPRAVTAFADGLYDACLNITIDDEVVAQNAAVFDTNCLDEAKRNLAKAAVVAFGRSVTIRYKLVFKASNATESITSFYCLIMFICRCCRSDTPDEEEKECDEGKTSIIGTSSSTQSRFSSSTAATSLAPELFAKIVFAFVMFCF